MNGSDVFYPAGTWRVNQMQFASTCEYSDIAGYCSINTYAGTLLYMLILFDSRGYCQLYFPYLSKHGQLLEGKVHTCAKRVFPLAEVYQWAETPLHRYDSLYMV